MEHWLTYLTENWKRVALIAGVGIIGIFCLVKLFGKTSSVQLDHPDGFPFVCQNPSCHYEFTISVSEAEEIRTKHPGEPLKCPKCGQTNVLPAGAHARPVNLPVSGAAP
jgi:hypothetical protein